MNFLDYDTTILIPRHICGIRRNTILGRTPRQKEQTTQMNRPSITRNLLTFAVMIYSSMSAGQQVAPYDTIIDMGYYKSYYSYAHRAPSFVIYSMYKPRTKVARTGMSFWRLNDMPTFPYFHSGYDRGHLCAAADRAESRQAMYSTFCFVNIIPQTPALNRKLWKYYETYVRNMSQADSLTIICGGCDWDTLQTYIPRKCFKLVWDHRTHSWVMSMIFQNSSTPTVHDCDTLIKIFEDYDIRVNF